MWRAPLPWASIILGISLFGPVACSGGGSSGTPTAPGAVAYSVADFITAVAWINGGSASQAAALPGLAGSLSVTPTTSTGVINGGSRVVRLRTSAPITNVYVTVKGVDRSVNGAWNLPVSGSPTDTYIIVTFSRTIPVTPFTMSIVVASGSSQVSAAADVPTVVHNAATGDVQVSVTWDTASDVDLHVIEPSGRRIYWGDKVSPTGGTLDLDSNAACSIDNVNNENIRWTSAPSGTYTVALDYWADCGAGPTRYVVTVNNGGSQSVFNGTFQPSDEDNTERRVITTFTRGTGFLRTTATPPSHLAILAMPLPPKR